MIMPVIDHSEKQFNVQIFSMKIKTTLAILSQLMKRANEHIFRYFVYLFFFL